MGSLSQNAEEGEDEIGSILTKFDTMADITAICVKTIPISLTADPERLHFRPELDGAITSCDGSKLKYFGSVWVSCQEVGGKAFEAAVIVNPARTVPATLLLGADFMSQRNMSINFPSRTVQLEGRVLDMCSKMNISFQKWPVLGSVQVRQVDGRGSRKQEAFSPNVVEAASRNETGQYLQSVQSSNKKQFLAAVLGKRGKRGISNWWWVSVAGHDPVNVRKSKGHVESKQSMQVTQVELSRLQKNDRKFGQLARRAVANFAVLMGDHQVLGDNVKPLAEAWHREYHKFRPLSQPVTSSSEARRLHREQNEFIRRKFEEYMNTGLSELSFFWTYLIDQCKHFFLKNKLLRSGSSSSSSTRSSTSSSRGRKSVEINETNSNNTTSSHRPIDPVRKQMICEVAEQCVRDMLTSDIEQSQNPEAYKVQENWKADLEDAIDRAEMGDKKELRRMLIERNHGCFSRKFGEMTHVVEFEVDKTAVPVRRRPFPLNAQQRQFLLRELAMMEEKGLIVRSDSEWCARGMLVRKSTPGEWRLVCDYRDINKHIKKNAYSVGKQEEMLNAMAGARCISCLDAVKGFWQQKIAKHCQDFTAFDAGTGLFNFTRTPMGLSISSQTYQAAIDTALQPLANGLPDKDGNYKQGNGVCVYIDDICVFTAEPEDHMPLLEEVIKRLDAAGVQLAAAKCSLMQSSARFLGYLIDCKNQTIRPDEKNLSKLRNYTRPKRVKDVRSFLGLCSFYRQWIPNFVQLARPLQLLTHKSTKFDWSNTCEESFQLLKNALLNPNCARAMPDFDRAVRASYDDHDDIMTLWCDASDIGWGGCVSQGGRLIAVDGRTLSKAERNWSVTDRELGAIRWCLRKFRSLLIGFKIRICTDHKAIVDIWKRTDLYPKQIRAVQELMEFDFELCYIKGPNNEAADCASRYNFEVIESSRFDPVEALRERANVGICTRCRRQLDEDSGDVMLGDLNYHCKDNGRDVAKFQSRCKAAVVCGWPEDYFVDDEEDEDALEEKMIEQLHQIDSTMVSVEAVVHHRIRREEDAAERALTQFDPDQMFVDNLFIQQCEDRELRPVANHLKKGLPWNQFVGTNEYLGERREHVHHLTYHKKRHCVCYRNRIVLPKKFRTRFITVWHGGLKPHLSLDATLRELQLRYWWPTIRQDVIKLVNNCNGCKHEKIMNPPRAIFHKDRFGAIMIDFIELPSAYGEAARDTIAAGLANAAGSSFDVDVTKAPWTMCLVVVELSTRWPWVVPVPRANGMHTALALLNRVFPVMGFPRYIYSDNGAHFKNKLMAALEKLLGIEHIYGTAYHPASQGMVERLNASVKQFFVDFITNVSANWVALVGLLELRLRSRAHTALDGISPFQAFTAQVMRSIPAAAGCDPEWIKPLKRVDSKAMKSIEGAMQATMQVVRSADDDQSTLRALRWFEKFRTKFKQLTPGTAVWLKSGEVGESVKCVRTPAVVREQGETAKTYVVEYRDDNNLIKEVTVVGDKLEYRDIEPRLLLPEVDTIEVADLSVSQL